MSLKHFKFDAKLMKDYDKNKELSCLQYRDVNILYDWAMSQNFSVNNLE